MLNRLLKNIKNINIHFGDDDINKYFIRADEDIQNVISLNNKDSHALNKVMKLIINSLDEAHMFMSRMSHPSQKKIIDKDLNQAEDFAETLAKNLAND